MRLTSNWSTTEEVGASTGGAGAGTRTGGRGTRRWNQQQVAEAGLRRSERTRRAPERYGGSQPMHKEKSLAAKKVPREEWMIHQEGVWKKYRQPTE